MPPPLEASAAEDEAAPKAVAVAAAAGLGAAPGAEKQVGAHACVAAAAAATVDEKSCSRAALQQAAGGGDAGLDVYLLPTDARKAAVAAEGLVHALLPGEQEQGGQQQDCLLLLGLDCEWQPETHEQQRNKWVRCEGC